MAIADRTLTAEQKRTALLAAKTAGLCDGWHVEWDNRRKSKVWIAPGGVKTCWSLPQAVAWQTKVGIVEPSSVSKELSQNLQRRLTEEEVEVAKAEARRKGLPEGWRLEYDNRRGCKAWISPCGSRRCYTVGKAVAWSLEKGLVRLEQLPPAHKAMSEEEVATAMREAKERGLSEKWKVEWNFRKGIRVWICPETSRRCFSIAEALRKQNNTDGGSGSNVAAKSQTQPEKKIQKGSPTDLPPGWTIEWDEEAKRNVFLSPNKDKKCLSIKEVLTWSLKNGLFRGETARSSTQKKRGKSQLTEEEKRKALKLAKSQGLGDGWTVEWDKKSMQRVWYAPQRRKKCQSLPEALAWASKNCVDNASLKKIRATSIGELTNTSAGPHIPKGENLAAIPSGTSKRTVYEDLTSEPATNAKKQKIEPSNNNSLVVLANAALIPAPATSSASIAAAAPSMLLGRHGGLSSTPSPLSQRDLLAQCMIAGGQPLSPSLAHSSHPSMVMAASAPHLGFRSDLRPDGLAQDLLTIRSERILAARMAMRREMLLDAAMMRNAATFPSSTFRHPFMG